MIRRAIGRLAGPIFVFTIMVSIGLVVGLAIVGHPTP